MAPRRQLTVDQGRCILCGRCVAARPDLFAWSVGATGPDAAALARQALVVPQQPETDEAIAAARAALADRTAALRRSVHIRHVDAGSDGSEEWEIQALLGPVYDIHRLGVFFTASPRHADVLMVTGAGTAGMTGPLRTTYEGMPDPKVVIAVGTDAVSGGLLSGPGRPEWTACPGGRVGSGEPADPVLDTQRFADRDWEARDGRSGTVSALLAAGMILLAAAAAVGWSPDGPGGLRGAPYALGTAGSALPGGRRRVRAGGPHGPAERGGVARPARRAAAGHRPGRGPAVRLVPGDGAGRGGPGVGRVRQLGGQAR